MLAAARMGNAAQECPETHLTPVLAAFNRALVIMSTKVPGRFDSYEFLSRTEMATLLDILCDMQAVGCILQVRKMYAKTESRMVNHSFGRFCSDSKLGLLDFLACMGVEDVRKKDKGVSKARHNFRCTGSTIQDLYRYTE